MRAPPQMFSLYCHCLLQTVDADGILDGCCCAGSWLSVRPLRDPLRHLGSAGLMLHEQLWTPARGSTECGCTPGTEPVSIFARRGS